MKTTIINLIFAIILAIPTANASIEPKDLLFDTPPPTVWNSGPLTSRYLDHAHTQHTDDIMLKPGTYNWTLVTQKRNNKKGKVNFDIKEIYKNGSNKILLNKKYSPGTTKRGTITISDWKSKTNGTAGYAKLKVHIGRAGANTNVNYRIDIRKKNGTATGCTYASLGSTSGSVVAQTTAKKTFVKKACKNVVRVKVNKTGGKARTTVNVYASSTKNGTGVLKDTYEFPNGKAKTNHTFTLNNVNGKFIRVEMRNRSSALRFNYSTSANQ